MSIKEFWQKRNWEFFSIVVFSFLIAMLYYKIGSYVGFDKGMSTSIKIVEEFNETDDPKFITILEIERALWDERRKV